MNTGTTTLVLLPGMDGTGKLFEPLLNELPADICPIVISYPDHECLGYSELADHVQSLLPKKERFILLAESFSGPVAYLLAQRSISNLLGIIFVASFLRSPNKALLGISKVLPMKLALKLPIPRWVIQNFLLGNTKPDIFTLVRDTLKDLNTDIIAFRLTLVRKLNLALTKIAIPAAYLQALNDKLVDSDNVRKFEQIGEIQLIKMKGPHFLLQARPKQCTAAICSEVKRIVSLYSAYDS